MGEYEDRYPDAYGRDEVPPAAPTPEGRKEPPRPGRERFSLRSLVGGGLAGGSTASEVPAAPAPWQHAPAETAQTIEPTAPPQRPDRNYRGVGPRGYVRSPQRIYEDICDRLTEHPQIDASDIEVLISGIEVVLAGSIDNAIAAGRAEAVARDVSGVKTVRNRLQVRAAADR